MVLKFCSNKAHGIPRSYIVTLLWVTLLFFVVADGVAFGNKLKPSISISEIYSDNIDLEVEREANSALITEVTPAVMLLGAGAQFSYDISYSPIFYYYRSQQSSSRIQHVLNSKFNSNIIGQSVTLDGGAMISGYLSDTGKGLIDNDISIRKDQNELRRMFIRPNLNAKLADTLYLRSSYEINRVTSLGRIDKESTGRAFLFDVASMGTTLSWALNYKNESIDRDNNTNIEASDASVTLRYSFSEQLKFNIMMGHEKNNGSLVINLDDRYWGGGVDWVPSTAFFASASCGVKVYGELCQISSEYKAKSLFLGAKLNEVLVFGRDQNYANVTECDEGDDACQLKEEATVIASLPFSDGIFEMRVIQLYSGWVYRKITLKGQLSKTERDYLALDVVERLYDATLGVTFKYTNSSQFKADIAKQYNSTVKGTVDSYMLRFSYLFQRTRNLRFKAMLQAKDNSSSVDVNNYREHRASFNVHFTF